jgi:hypothetical protein
MAPDIREQEIVWFSHVNLGGFDEHLPVAFRSRNGGQQRLGKRCESACDKGRRDETG